MSTPTSPNSADRALADRKLVAAIAAIFDMFGTGDEMVLRKAEPLVAAHRASAVAEAVAGLEAKHETEMSAVGQYEETLRKKIERAESDRDAAIDREHDTTERLLAAEAALAAARGLHVLGHPATKEWCAAVDEHHAGTDQTCVSLAAKNAALREGLEKICASNIDMAFMRDIANSTLAAALHPATKEGKA